MSNASSNRPSRPSSATVRSAWSREPLVKISRRPGRRAELHARAARRGAGRSGRCHGRNRGRRRGRRRPRRPARAGSCRGDGNNSAASARAERPSSPVSVGEKQRDALVDLSATGRSRADRACCRDRTPRSRHGRTCPASPFRSSWAARSGSWREGNSVSRGATTRFGEKSGASKGSATLAPAGPEGAVGSRFNHRPPRPARPPSAAPGGAAPDPLSNEEDCEMMSSPRPWRHAACAPCGDGGFAPPRPGDSVQEWHMRRTDSTARRRAGHGAGAIGRAPAGVRTARGVSPAGFAAAFPYLAALADAWRSSPPPPARPRSIAPHARAHAGSRGRDDGRTCRCRDRRRDRDPSAANTARRLRDARRPVHPQPVGLELRLSLRSGARLRHPHQRDLFARRGRRLLCRRPARAVRRPPPGRRRGRTRRARRLGRAAPRSSSSASRTRWRATRRASIARADRHGDRRDAGAARQPGLARRRSRARRRHRAHAATRRRLSRVALDARRT